MYQAGREPHRQRCTGVLKDRPYGARDPLATGAALPHPPGGGPARTPAPRTPRPRRPAQPVQVVHARLAVGEPRPQLGIRARIVQTTRRHVMILPRAGSEMYGPQLVKGLRRCALPAYSGGVRRPSRGRHGRNISHRDGRDRAGRQG